MRLLQTGGAECRGEKIVSRKAALDDRALSAPAQLGARLGAWLGAAQRSTGRIDLIMKPRGAVTVLERLHQAGPLRLRLLRPEPGCETTAILLNTGGGIAGGDTHDIAIVARASTELTLSTQGAERVYRAGDNDAAARVSMRFDIGADAQVSYLPQETILFDRSALNRRMRIDLASSSRYLSVETLIFGRAAMGEIIERLDLRDVVELHRDGALVFRDAIAPPTRFSDSARGAMLGDAAGVATVLLAAPDASSWLEPVRAVLGEAQAGASAWNGLLLVRILAQTGSALRQIVLKVLSVLQGGRAMPRVWAC